MASLNKKWLWVSHPEPHTQAFHCILMACPLASAPSHTFWGLITFIVVSGDGGTRMEDEEILGAPFLLPVEARGPWPPDPHLHFWHAWSLGRKFAQARSERE